MVNNNDPIIRTAGVDAAKSVRKDIGWYVPHFTPRLEQPTNYDGSVIEQRSN